jgi:hypothetical protein
MATQASQHALHIAHDQRPCTDSSPRRQHHHVSVDDTDDAVQVFRALTTCLPVEVCNGNNLATDVVVESVDTVGVDEAVSDPAASPHGLLDVTHHLSHGPNNAEKCCIPKLLSALPERCHSSQGQTHCYVAQLRSIISFCTFTLQSGDS